MGFSLQGLFPSQGLRRLSAPVTFMTLARQAQGFGSGLPNLTPTKPVSKALLPAKIRHPLDPTFAEPHGPLPSWASNL